MGMTLTEKILARTSGSDVLHPGEIVWVEPDLMIAHDLNYGLYRRRLRSIGIDTIAHPERLLLTIDHQPYTGSPAVSADFDLMRNDARELGIAWFYDLGRAGISHNLPVEKGHVRPGMLVLTSDTRSPALGAVGALSIALGGGFMVPLGTGKGWLRVPTTLRVNVTGTRRPWVLSRDIAQWIAAQIGSERGDYRVIEFGGSVVEAMDVEERHTLCNSMVDVGAKGAVAEPSQGVLDYVRARSSEPFEVVRSDPDAVYEAVLDLDISAVEPQVCAPPSPELAHPVSDLAGKPVTYGFVGSCISGKLEDMRAAAAILKGRKVKDGVRLYIIPATQDVYRQSVAEGLIDVFANADAQLAVGTCGPCYGAMAPLNDGDVCISTGTRNDPRRMGSGHAEVYLASAATVAASAVTGVITDPNSLH